jgi:hypothetical protein
MARKNTPIPSDEDLKLEVKRTLLEAMRSATREKRISYECDQHHAYTGNGRGYKHQINIPIEDWGNRIKACQDLLDRIDGKAATRKEAPKLKTSGRSLDELTDEELEQIILQGEEPSPELPEEES